MLFCLGAQKGSVQTNGPVHRSKGGIIIINVNEFNPVRRSLWIPRAVCVCVFPEQIGDNTRLAFERLVCANPAQMNINPTCNGQVVCGRADIYTYRKEVNWYFAFAC